MSETKIPVKLIVDTKANKVLFAEAGKQFVDFLFRILSLPIGIAVKLLGDKGNVGSLGDLCKGFEALHPDYFESYINKDLVIKPVAAANSIPFCALDYTSSITDKQWYKCPTAHTPTYISDDKMTSCPKCKSPMSGSVIYVPPSVSPTNSTLRNENGGYVKGLYTYMVMDNLEVKTLSAACLVTLMSEFNVKGAAALTVQEVQVGFSEGLDILKASFQTEAVLTTVFLAMKSSPVKTKDEGPSFGLYKY